MLYPLLAAATEPAATALTPESTMPIGMMWVILGTAVTGTFFLAGVYFKLTGAIDELRKLARNAWTVQDHTVWSAILGKQNPTLDLPDVRKVNDPAGRSGD